MIIQLRHNNIDFSADLSKPIDISIPLIPDSETPKCFWAPNFEAQPVRAGEWVGDTTEGGSVNFKTVTLNPHGNGTHTECVGHISTEKVTINAVLKKFHMIAELVTIIPSKLENGDRCITIENMKMALPEIRTKAIVIRTTPNDEDKLNRNYSGTNPCYLHHEAISYLVDHGIDHLLVDLPSVDREEDGGLLLGHKAFWNYPATLDNSKTISELIYVNNSVSDGLYLLNLQIASFELDASPSKPVLYRLE